MNQLKDGGKTFIAIDLKSFYASVECTQAGVDPMDALLVVADKSRTEKTICLAVSPALKAMGIGGRARLFEVVERVKQINAERLKKAPGGKFTGSSNIASALKKDPSLKLDYIVATPRMAEYMRKSTQIYNIYLRYVSAEDIHVYSVDEVFIDATSYLKLYDMEPRDFTMKLIRAVLSETGITATAGIGTNMYLCKIAMDIVAKRMPADDDGVRIAELDEMSYRHILWDHVPLTDFWRVGKGYARRLAKAGIYTMGDIARCSVYNEDLLYKMFGVNAELLIDHAWGWEPTEISTIKSYKPQTNSISSGQVLMEPYAADDAKLIVKEMTELLVLDLVKKDLVTKKIELTIGYDRESLEYDHKGFSINDSTFKIKGTDIRYKGKVTTDHFGRPMPYHAHGTGNIDRWTSSTSRIMEVMVELFDSIIDPSLLVRRITIVACNLIPISEIPADEPFQMDLFTDYDALEK